MCRKIKSGQDTTQKILHEKMKSVESQEDKMKNKAKRLWQYMNIENEFC